MHFARPLMRLPLSLLAFDDFRAGELGYAQPRGVLRATAMTSPRDGFPVRALVDVRAWQHGSFEEVEPLIVKPSQPRIQR